VTSSRLQILVINSGSSSLKFSVLEVQSEAVLASGIAERLGTTDAVLKFGSINTKKIEERLFKRGSPSGFTPRNQSPPSCVAE
jgi:acetate kinase